MKFKRIAIDTSKHVFTIHGVDEQEWPVLRRELKRGQVEAFFSKVPGTEGRVPPRGVGAVGK
jgi:transposase